MGDREYLVRQANTVGLKFPDFFDLDRHTPAEHLTSIKNTLKITQIEEKE